MNKTGAELVVFALEQIGVEYTFGVPGVHNTEIYDSLNSSKKIEPILVTHECGAAFMGLGVSCTSKSIGTCVIVPAAGVTNAMSGIGEAFLDGIPLLIISGGTRRDTNKSYQLHQLNQEKLVAAITKKYFLIEHHSQIISTIYEAYNIATSGEPGPVFIEVPVEIQMFRGEVNNMPVYKKLITENKIDLIKIKQAAELLSNAKAPGIYVGWGAVDAVEFTKNISEKLIAPVCTTLQGKSSFPASHPFHSGFGFGANAVPASQAAFKDIDAMLAVGVRFSELGTGSFGAKVPEKLIHIDINPEVFNKNYPATICIEGDATEVLKLIDEELKKINFLSNRNAESLKNLIATEKNNYNNEWKKEKRNDIVSPGYFFESLIKFSDDDAYIFVDDGAHTYLTTELMPIEKGRHFVTPTDFNCMGFCVPAAIGSKFMNKEKNVIGIVGDGAFLMTGMELVTAVTQKLAMLIFIFHDGELGQIAQFQQIPMNRKTASVIGDINFEDFAKSIGANFVSMNNDLEIDEKMKSAFDLLKDNLPVIIDVKIDYSKKTLMTKGVVKTNLSRFPLSEKIRFTLRAALRHITG